jgi:hypothetical protein
MKMSHRKESGHKRALTITINAGRATIVLAPGKEIWLTMEWVEREHIVRCVDELECTKDELPERAP